MANGYRVTCSIEIRGQKYSNTAYVTSAQVSDPAVRNKIRRYLQHQLIEGVIDQTSGFSWEVVQELDVSTFTPDATGEARRTEVEPPPSA